jgi:hypothetical protein
MSRAVLQSERGSPIQPFLSHPSSRRMAEPATDPVIDTPVPTSEATGSEEVKYKVKHHTFSLSMALHYRGLGLILHHRYNPIASLCWKLAFQDD